MALSITAALVQNSAAGTLVKGNAAAPITAGQVVYRNDDGDFDLADANGTTPAFRVAGIALNDADQDQPVEICTGDAEFVPGATLTAGVIYILSGTTPGGIEAASAAAVGWNIQLLGVAVSASVLYLKITNSNGVKAA